MKEPDRTGNPMKPMIVFAGRSNVGKSSTIRGLTGKKVRIGKKPGSTRWELMIDFGPITIVDIPGFGYMAGQSKTTIEETKVNVVQKLESWKDDISMRLVLRKFRDIGTDKGLSYTMKEGWKSLKLKMKLKYLTK